MFERIAIAGLGLIGGSIALAIRERWPECRVTGVDTRAVLAHALGSGAIERTADSIDAVGDVDLIVLCAPVRQNVELLAGAMRASHGETLVTDVGGTKHDIVQAARDLPHPERFIGGHPIGGGERGGFGFARPDLFQTRPWILTPDHANGSDSLGRLTAFVSGLGAWPALMQPDEHDRLMAFLSHLPQLTASVLMQVAGAGATAEGLPFAGRGLIDTTRLAASPANVWRDICAVNAGPIGDALDELIARLTTLRASLGDGAAVEAVFADAARWRAELMRTPRGA